MKTVDLNKDQLALLNGSSDVEVMSLEEMYTVAGGQSCPYGTKLTPVTTQTCNWYGCTTTTTYVCR
jgi:hypothetical protein